MLVVVYFIKKLVFSGMFLFLGGWYIRVGGGWIIM